LSPRQSRLLNDWLTSYLYIRRGTLKTLTSILIESSSTRSIKFKEKNKPPFNKVFYCRLEAYIYGFG